MSATAALFREQEPAAGYPVVQVQGLRFRYPDGVVVFDGVDLEVRAGELVCVLGPSGCGKTTLLKIVAGLLDGYEGQVTVLGRPVAAPRPDVAVVFQHFGLLPWKTVYENVAFGLRIRGLKGATIDGRVRHFIRLVGLEGFEHAYPYQLSGGMQQRVGLARALALQPALLLMDEPFGALDAQTREALQEELLRILSTQSPTVLFITHSIDEAIVLGHRILVLSRRPARVQRELSVPFGQQRNPTEVRASPEYAKLRQHLWELLREGAVERA